MGYEVSCRPPHGWVVAWAKDPKCRGKETQLEQVNWI